VAVDFPELNLVMAHAGRGFWYDRAFFLAKLHANVYLEISGLPPSKLMTYFPELDRLTGKVIFGSDWPGMPWIRRNMEAIGKLPLSAEGVEKILGGNAARLLRL
jgi:predicted TIM-barrel fold metal-dependent hydrolase